MKQNDSCFEKQHFTLIELLVVISIIAILAAMLLPSLSKARDTSKKAPCAANLKQLSTASLMYNDDYKFLPPGAPDKGMVMNGDNGKGNCRRWYAYSESSYWDGSATIDYTRGLLYTYFHDVNVLKCPAFAHQADFGSVARGSGGYGYNCRQLGNMTGNNNTGTSPNINDYAGCPFSNFKKSTSQVLMFSDIAGLSTSATNGSESCSNTASGSIIEHYFQYPFYTNSTNAKSTVHFRHSGLTTGVAWCDGHVDFNRMTYTPSGDAVAWKRLKLGFFGEIKDGLNENFTSATHYFGNN